MSEVTPNTNAPSPDNDPAYVEKMVAKAEGREPNAPPPENAAAQDEAPLILGKFKSQDDLVKAYQELEKKIGAKAPETPAAPAKAPEGDKDKVTPEGDKAKDTTNETPATNDAAKALEAQGLDYAEFNEEFAANGSLSEASYEKLAKANIPRHMVDEFIAGRVAVANQMKAEVFQHAGGEDQYAAAVAWAATNMTDAEKAAFNKVVNGSDLAATKLAVSGLMGRYRSAEGAEPNLVAGDAAPSGGDTYSSWSEIMSDMKKPEYNSDPAFRKRVEQKVARSNI